MFGGAGDDDLWGDGGDDVLYGEDGNDYLNGLDGNNRLFGGAGNDVLEGGGAGSDFLSGGAGDDELVAYQGGDTLEGGSGADEFKFFVFNPSSPLAASARVLDFEGAGAAGGDLVNLSSSPYLSFQGQIAVNPVAGAAMSGAGNGLTDVFYTVRDGITWLLADENDNGVLDATDTAIQFSGVQAFTEADFTASTNFAIAGTGRADVLVGTQDDDVIFGLGGNDRLDGGAGNDILYGGAGSDTLKGGTGFDTLYGDAGNDTLSLKDSDFGGSAYGGEGADVLIGGDITRSTLDGGAGNDTLRAGAAGADMVDFDGGNGQTGWRCRRRPVLRWRRQRPVCFRRHLDIRYRL
jgi:Ca2+-binding RTX toxin-like protein